MAMMNMMKILITTKVMYLYVKAKSLKNDEEQTMKNEFHGYSTK